MFKKFKITCDEATTICDKNQYGEATFTDKLKLQLHILTCKICAQYSEQNALLTKIYKRKAKSDQTQTSSLCMSSEEKERLRKELENFSV
jgi:predicted anti-sigma-YlaC factor YlaD